MRVPRRLLLWPEAKGAGVYMDSYQRRSLRGGAEAVVSEALEADWSIPGMHWKGKRKLYSGLRGGGGGSAHWGDKLLLLFSGLPPS